MEPYVLLPEAAFHLPLVCCASGVSQVDVRRGHAFPWSSLLSQEGILTCFEAPITILSRSCLSGLLRSQAGSSCHKVSITVDGRQNSGASELYPAFIAIASVLEMNTVPFLWVQRGRTGKHQIGAGLLNWHMLNLKPLCSSSIM